MNFKDKTNIELIGLLKSSKGSDDLHNYYNLVKEILNRMNPNEVNPIKNEVNHHLPIHRDEDDQMYCGLCGRDLPSQFPCSVKPIVPRVEKPNLCDHCHRNEIYLCPDCQLVADQGYQGYQGQGNAPLRREAPAGTSRHRWHNRESPKWYGCRYWRRFLRSVSGLRHWVDSGSRSGFLAHYQMVTFGRMAPRRVSDTCRSF